MDSPGAAMRTRSSWSLPLFMGGIFGALSTIATIGDPDLFWHLAQGRQTVTDGLARVDVFSWSVNGLPVLTDQWLGQVIRSEERRVGKECRCWGERDEEKKKV